MAEPLIVIRHRSTHEWRLENWNWRVGNPMTWTLHFLMDGTANYVRCADQHETALLNECKRLVDAAHGVKASERARWTCLLCKSLRPGYHGTLDDKVTPCPNGVKACGGSQCEK